MRSWLKPDNDMSPRLPDQPAGWARKPLVTPDEERIAEEIAKRFHEMNGEGMRQRVIGRKPPKTGGNHEH